MVNEPLAEAPSGNMNSFGKAAMPGLANFYMDLYGKFNKSARRAKKKQAQMEKARAHAAMAQTQRQIDLRAMEEPRELSALKSQFAARRLSPKSSMYGEDISYLSRQQAAQRASLADQMNLQRMGLSLMKRQARLSRRMQPLGIAQGFLQSLQGAAGAMAGMPGMGG